MLILSSEDGLCDVVSAVVSEDLTVFPVRVGLRQRAQALQELRVQHQVLCLQHVPGQFQFWFGTHEAVSLARSEGGRWRLMKRCTWSRWNSLNDLQHPRVCFLEALRENSRPSHLGWSTANLLYWFGVFGIAVIKANFKHARNGNAEGKRGLGGFLLPGVVTVVRVCFVRLRREIEWALCLSRVGENVSFSVCKEWHL